MTIDKDALKRKYAEERARRLRPDGNDQYQELKDQFAHYAQDRYPGAQCDTASFVYMPLLEETGHMPTEKYVHAAEILEHSQRIGKQFGLYDNALFHTEVTDLERDDARSVWIVR